MPFAASARQRGSGQPDLPDGRDLHARDPLADGGQRIGEIADDDRSIVKQQALDLTGGPALAFGIERGGIGRHQPVIGRVAIARSVPGAVAAQGAARWTLGRPE